MTPVKDQFTIGLWGDFNRSTELKSALFDLSINSIVVPMNNTPEQGIASVKKFPNLICLIDADRDDQFNGPMANSSADGTPSMAIIYFTGDVRKIETWPTRDPGLCDIIHWDELSAERLYSALCSLNRTRKLIDRSHALKKVPILIVNSWPSWDTKFERRWKPFG